MSVWGPELVEGTTMGAASVRTLTLTCRVAPSQWEGQLTDGRMFYVRVQHGELQVRVSPEPTSNVEDAVRAVPALSLLLEDSPECFMDEPVMREMTATVLDFSALGPAQLGLDL